MPKLHWPRFKRQEDLTPDTSLPAAPDGHSGPRDEYDRVVRIAAKTQSWYFVDRKPKRCGSKILRLNAILFGGAGAIAPIITAKDPTLSPYIGYVLLFIAGASIATDRALGLSTGWARDIHAATRIHHIVSNFRYRWAALEASRGPKVPSILEYIDLAESAEQAILEVNTSETLEWIAEFTKSNDALDARYSADDEPRPRQ